MPTIIEEREVLWVEELKVIPGFVYFTRIEDRYYIEHVLEGRINSQAQLHDPTRVFVHGPRSPGNLFVDLTK